MPAPKAADALAALRTDDASGRAPGALRSFAAAVVTLGVWPAIRWTSRFEQVIARDHATLTRLAEWSRRRLPEPQARCLAEAAGGVRQRPWAVPAVFLIVALTLLSFSTLLEVARARDGVWPTVIGSTFGFRWAQLLHPSDPGVGAFLVWTVGLSAAYGTHLLQIHLHARAVRRFLDEFNRTIVVEEGFPPVLLDPIAIGFSPLWVLAAGTLLFLGSAWAIPFAVAGANDGRYRRRASVRLRQDLAARVRDVIFASPELSRPVLKVPVDAVRCATPGCGGALGPKSKFCPRCGTRRGRSLDRAA